MIHRENNPEQSRAKMHDTIVEDKWYRSFAFAARFYQRRVLVRNVCQISLVSAWLGVLWALWQYNIVPAKLCGVLTVFVLLMIPIGEAVASMTWEFSLEDFDTDYEIFKSVELARGPLIGDAVRAIERIQCWAKIQTIASRGGVYAGEARILLRHRELTSAQSI
jgi:hypothetical protein